MISPAGDVDPAGCPDPCFCSSLVQFLNWYRQLPSGRAMFTHLAAAAHLLKSGRCKLPDISANFGLVARLDVSTTGLQVFCLDPEHRAAVRSKLHEAGKLYLVGVPSTGSLPEGQSVMTTLWMRQLNDGLTSTVVSSLHPRSGYSKTTCVFHSLRTAGNMTVIACELHQGFRHQIRQHAAFALKTPILGDTLYGSTVPQRNGIALHSYSLCLGQDELRVPVPASFSFFESSLITKSGYLEAPLNLEERCRMCLSGYLWLEGV